ncbi:OPT/YSL family transporter [Candidatus Peregrinibacteria bacterium]|nr:OPT/YSL family transporter [Candidatus Peregrinibacteria bacterium]
MMEITWQSIVGALLVSSIVSAAYPYVVLKLGLGPNVSVVSAFLGALFLSFTARRTIGTNRYQNNVIQTAGTSAAMTAFMCVVAAAFGYIEMNESVQVKASISPWQMFFWLTLTGMLGVIFTVLFRRHFIEDPKMIFVDGVVAAETVNVLDSRGGEASKKMRAMGVTALVSAVMAFFRDGIQKLAPFWFSKSYKAAMPWDLLTIGSGMLLGLNMGLSLLAGTVLGVYVIGPWLLESGVGLEIVRSNIAAVNLARCDALFAIKEIAEKSPDAMFFAQHCGGMAGFKGGSYFATMMLWAMWPATGMMIAASLAALLLKWRTLVDTFHMLRRRQADAVREDVSMKTIVVLGLGLTVILAVVQKANFGMGYVQTVVSVAASLPLMLIGIRVLGETNQGPVSLMANALQALFAVFWPNQIVLNLIGAGMAGNTSAQSEGLMQDFKTGKIVGSTPRILTWVQFCAVPIGAAAVAIMYPLLIAKYGLGGDGLAAPTGLKIANLAVVLSKGIEALPRHALSITVWAMLVGAAIECAKHYRPKWGEYLPSPSGLGFGVILPGILNIPMALGCVLGWVWEKNGKESYDKYAATVAAGFVGGDALIAGILIPILAAIGILTLQ